jgi:uncharacterized RDD family membrane protein YckC
MLVLNFTATAFFVIAETGPYDWMLSLLGSSSEIDILSVLLTFIITCIPTLIFIWFIRGRADVPSFKEQLTDLGPFTPKFKTDADISKYGELPSVFSRILAFIIDRGLVILFIVIPAGIFIAVTEQTGRDNILYFVMLAVFIAFMLAGIVYSYARDMFGGKSIARRLLKQKVVDVTTGEPIGGLRSFKRELIIHFAPLILIEMLLMFSKPDRRRMGDNWAKSIVVKDIS